MSLDQKNVAGDWLKDEFGAPNYCREVVTIASGENLESGAVVGKITASGKYAHADNDAGDGTETAAGILIEAVDATTADKTGVILKRGPAVVSKAGLKWNASEDADDIAANLADLLALGIVARDGV